MPKVAVTFACGLYDRMSALYTGEVKPESIDLNFLAIDEPRQIFDRMGKNLDFDACEMSSSEVFSRLAAGRNEMVALPVFPSRVFRHGFITVNSKAVKTPKDLEGKRIGVPLYTQTAAIFIRGLLQDEYGVDLSGVHWVQGATNSPHSHGNPSAPPLIKPVSIEQNASGHSLSELLERNDIQAIIGSGLPVPAIAALEALTGVCVTGWFTLWETSIQEQIPEHAVSRVGSYDMMVAIGFLPVGAVLVGPIADALGLRATLIGMSAIGIACALCVLSVPAVRQLRRPAAALL